MTYLENKYTNWYNELIERRRKEVPDGYSEKHHILPRCLGGSDDPDNLVALTAREHYIAHLLLTRMTEGNARSKLWWAFHRMLFSNGGSRAYEFNRKRWAKWLSENHPSKRDETGDQWRETVSKIVTEHWKDNSDRRIKTANKMSETNERMKRETPDAYYEQQRKNAVKGAAAAREVLSLKLEYKGKIYIGYQELMEQAGISKHLYNKLYKQGYDPEFRKGKNGPMTNEEIEELTGQFCHKTMIDYPTTTDMWFNTLNRMANIGLISRHICDRFMKQFTQNQFNQTQGGKSL